VKKERAERERERESTQLNTTLILVFGVLFDVFVIFRPQETLDKMKESIDVTSSTFENETGVPIIRRLEEFNLTSAYQAGDGKAK
jgi:hypothetical protein